MLKEKGVERETRKNIDGHAGETQEVFGIVRLGATDSCMPTLAPPLAPIHETYDEGTRDDHCSVLAERL